jgi:hypothetical protein
MKIDYRLPEHLKPTLYELKIQPYIGPIEIYGNNSFTFEGENRMHFICAKPTNKIIFHSVNLKINNASLSSSDDKDIKLEESHIEVKQKEYVVFKLNRDCKPNVLYTIAVSFNGQIANVLYGFYRSSYKDSKGVTH